MGYIYSSGVPLQYMQAVQRTAFCVQFFLVF